MAVTACNERWQNRDGSFAAENDSEAQRHWLIKTDNKFDNALTIRSALSGTLPAFLSPHPNNLFYTCRSLTIDPLDSTPFAWTATASYSTKPLTQDEKNKQAFPNPLLRPTITTTEGVQREKYVNRDRDGIAFTNSAGDYFPAQVVDDDRVVISLTKNVATRTPTIFSYSNSLNDANYSVDGWNIVKNCAKIGRFKYSELQEENGYEYYILTAEIQVLASKEEWEIRLLDEGFHKLVSGERKKILIENDDGEMEPPAEAVPLNGSGDTLEPSDPQWGDGGGVFRSWDYYREMDWSQLPF